MSVYWKIAWKKQTLSIFWEMLFKHEETILNLVEMPVFSPTLASGDQNAMQQHNAFGVRGETRPEKPLLLLLLSPPTHITQSHIGTRSRALFQKTIWYLLSSFSCWVAEISLAVTSATHRDEWYFVCGVRALKNDILSTQQKCFLLKPILCLFRIIHRTHFQ